MKLILLALLSCQLVNSNVITPKVVFAKPEILKDSRSLPQSTSSCALINDVGAVTILGLNLEFWDLETGKPQRSLIDVQQFGISDEKRWLVRSPFDHGFALIGLDTAVVLILRSGMSKKPCVLLC